MDQKTEVVIGFTEVGRRIRRMASICEDKGDQKTARDLRATDVLLRICVDKVKGDLICIEEVLPSE